MSVCGCVCVCVWICVWVGACVWVCVCVCVCVCVDVWMCGCVGVWGELYPVCLDFWKILTFAKHRSKCAENNRHLYECFLLLRQI